MILASQEKHSQHFGSDQEAVLQNVDPFNTSNEYNSKSSNDIEQSQNDDIDEARYNLATRIMSNGVEVIIASDKTKMPDHLVPDISNSQHQYNKPMTLAASTIKNQMMILLFPSSNSAWDNKLELNHSTQQFNYNLPPYTNHFITKTCLTTYTYRTTYVQDGHTTVESREKVISNIATEERNYPKITPTQTLGVTLTKTPDLAVGIFPTTYSYFNTFKDNSDKLQIMTSEYTVINTITGPNEYVAYLQPTAKATPALKTNTYYDEITLSQKIKSKLYTITKNLTQVVVTKSYTPAYSTSVLTTYYAYDDDSLVNVNDRINTPTAALVSSEEDKEATTLLSEITEKVDDIHIYATKTFFTTFTYYTTTVLKSFLADNSQTELGEKPLSTVFNYYTRVIENVITESVPATLLPNELLVKMKTELKQQKPYQRRRLIVTTATLKDGQTVKISAMEMFKENLPTAALDATPSSTNSILSTQSVIESSIYSQEETEDHYHSEGDLEENEDFDLEESTNSPLMENNENVKHPEISDVEEDNNGFVTLPSEQIFTVIEAPIAQTSSNNAVSVNNEKPAGTAANQLIQRLTALKPMFNAMADLLQNNFGTSLDSIKPIKITESKQVPTVKINSSLTDTQHPIYIPVEKSPAKKNPTENLKFTELISQSLHIKPPLMNNDEEYYGLIDKDKSHLIPLTTLSRQEQPLHNGGIYIRPGEIITANSDVIVGKPNGIEYIQLPKHNHHNQADKNISNVNTLDNHQFQVTYYHNKVQHPYKKKSASTLPAITNKPQHIPILSNKFTAQTTYGLKPPNDSNFNKNILKPPPPPPAIPLKHQSSIPLHSQQGLSLMLKVPDKPSRIKQQTSKAYMNLFNDSMSHLFTPQLLPSLRPNKPESPPLSVPPLRGTHHFYSFNNELKNNEILEIKQIPQVFSVDLKPSSVLSSRKPQLQTETFAPQKKLTTEKTVENWPNGREQQTLTGLMRLQPDSTNNKPESVTKASSAYKKITPNSFENKGKNPQFDFSSTPPHFGSLEKTPKRENTLRGTYVLMNSQDAPQTQAQIHNQYPPLHTKFSDKEISFKGFPSSPNVKLYPNPFTFSNPYYVQEEHQKQQSINYPNDSVTKNLHNISLDQHILSHTVDVNVPPLTFNREDYDYPKQAATAVRGQIPPATVKTLNTLRDTGHKYMPLITIPANEQQVQVSLTPSNSVSTLTHPQEAGNKSSWKSPVTNNENSNNIVRKISQLNDKFKYFSSDQDQKTLATSNILNIKPKLEANNNWKHHRRQPLASFNRLSNKSQMSATTMQSLYSAQQIGEEKKSKTPQRMKSTLQPFRHLQHTKNSENSHLPAITTVQPFTPGQTNLKYTYSHESQSQTQTDDDDWEKMQVNKPKWLISPPKPDIKTRIKQQIPSNGENSKDQNGATRVSTQKLGQFNEKLNKLHTTTRTSTTFKTTANPKMKQRTSKPTTTTTNKKPDDNLQVSELKSQGEPFKKSNQNKRVENKELNGPTKSATIFVAPGEGFQAFAKLDKSNEKQTVIKTEESTTKKNQSSLPKNIFITGETQKSSIKAASPSETSPKPLKADGNNLKSKVNTAATETVLGLNPPPLVKSQNLSSTSETQQQQTSSKEKSYEMKQGEAQVKVEKIFPTTTTLTKTAEVLSTTKKPTTRTTTTNTVKVTQVEKARIEQNLTTNDNSITSRKSSENLRSSNLQPSETYERKMPQTTTSPLAQHIFTLTTTTTVKRIVLPTKYLMNKRVYTVTTTATAPQQLSTSSIQQQTTTSISSTTETTTEVTTLFLTHTKVNTIVDTVTSVKTLEPITITTTTTIQPTLSTQIPTTKSFTADLTTEETPVSSTEPETMEINPDLTYLPYPSVEVVSTNITQEPPSFNPNENSIFIIMTNNKNKKNSIFTPQNTLTEADVILQADSSNGKLDETNEVMVEYDNGISFDDIPVRDEEPAETVNGKSIASSAFVNSAATAKENLPSDDHIILGGVLIATPPKFPNRQQSVNDTTISGCNPRCKTSRNEQCGLVDNRWSCVCRPGFARMFPDRPCKPTYTYDLLIHAERIGNYPLQYVTELENNKTEHYKQLSQLVNNALDRLIMQSDFRDAYHGVEVSNFSDDKKYKGIMINVLLQLSDNSNEKRLEEVFKKNLRLSNFSIGGTDLYTNKAGVDALTIKDFNECLSRKLNDCSEKAHCFNLPGTYTCSCVEGFVDLSDNSIYPGRICSSELIGCEICHYHGKRSALAVSSNDRNICECFPWYAGSKCQVNLKILLIVLLGIGTLLFILLLFCILITCTKRRNHVHHTALAPSTVTTSSGGLQKTTRLAANMVITSVGLRNSLRGVSLKNTKRYKSIKIDKRSMIKDSSSETSQNSLPYILKNQESISDGCNKRINHCRTFKNCASEGSTIEKYSTSGPLNIQAENHSELNTVITTSSSFKGNNKKIEQQQHLTRSSNDYESHYCEQSDRSLTVMIPRAKYHSSVLPQKQLMHHQLTMERVHKSSKPESSSFNLEKEAETKRNFKKSLPITRTISDNNREEKPTDIPSNPGALISAGFEVSAIVKDAAIIEHSCDPHNDLVLFDSIPPNYTLLSTSDPATSLDSDSGKKQVPNDRRKEYNSNKNFLTNESDLNVYKCEKDLIETMDEWLGNVKLNEVSAEARSFDETTILASTKPLRISIEGNQTPHFHDEVNTMAERDMCSTFLLPHTHLYKPERQESELSGFDSF